MRCWGSDGASSDLAVPERGFRAVALKRMTAFPPAPQDRIDIEKLIAHFGDRDVAEITEGDIFIAAHKICADTSNANKNRRVVAPAATILHFAAREEMRSWVRYNKPDAPLPAPRAIRAEKRRVGKACCRTCR